MPAEKITSLQNPRIKQLVKLRDRRSRDEAGVFLVEGYREIRRALEKGVALPELYYAPDWFLGENEPALIAQAEAAGAEVAALCGWLKKLELPPRWEGRVLNIHPGPLPEFGGQGMYGMNVHQAVLAAGAAASACTVHLVDNVYDHGRILARTPVPVLPGDTPEALQKRVYEQEMALYPEALRAFLVGLDERII